MDAQKVLKEFANHLAKISPDTVFGLESMDDEIKHIEDTYFPEVLKILQKDVEFFTVERKLFDTNLSAIWSASSDEQKEDIWKHLQGCMFAAFLHGDIEEKVTKIFGMVKKLWASSGKENDEVTRILNDEKSEGRFKEILDYVMNCRLAKLFTEIVESIDIKELDLNFENPMEIVDMLKNPEHPTVQRVVKKIQGMIEEKIKKGHLTQQTIIAEVEAIKAKVISLFGNVFNDALGGRKADVSSSVMIGNSPEARRQRMLARLQRKVREKNSQ